MHSILKIALSRHFSSTFLHKQHSCKRFTKHTVGRSVHNIFTYFSNCLLWPPQLAFQYFLLYTNHLYLLVTTKTINNWIKKRKKGGIRHLRTFLLICQSSLDWDWTCTWDFHPALKSVIISGFMLKAHSSVTSVMLHKILCPRVRMLTRCFRFILYFYYWVYA